MKNELQTLRLFSPLFPHIYRKNEWGDLDDYREDLSAGEVLEYEDKILALIQKERLPSEGERGLAVYLDDDLIRKVHSINPSVEEWNGELWGVTEVQTQGALSASELAELTEWLSSQFSDGWGEGLEQREIKVDDGELYVSFWDSSDRFFIRPEDELKGSQSYGFGMTMGGMR
ncbi:hypothetical protein Ami103574_02680 [Aminipila butyrica]|uniref:Uncharacterized protein n=1 Tax=Aminipila butyrica TaxID=433296 RepID=A0A858BT61_9FIRM|nr:hypothetical protein [Aminipila butyrica]QIB68285.1 hypothetical protein Ami103574_02680 [Aminipila butyrica]